MTKQHKINQWHGEFKTVTRFLTVLCVKAIPVTEAFQTHTKIQLLLVALKTQKYAVQLHLIGEKMPDTNFSSITSKYFPFHKKKKKS